jgi:hypothetical protein
MSTMTRGIVALSFATLTLASAAATAQELLPPEGRQGYYLGGGLRAGLLAGKEADVGSLGVAPSTSGVFRLGQMSTDWLGFGLRTGGGLFKTEEWEVGLGGLSLEAQLLPAPSLDLALHVSVGIAGAGLTRVDEAKVREDDPMGGAGALYTVGVSYDLFPFRERDSLESGGAALTFFVEGQLLDAGDLVVGGVFAGVDVYYWFGLARNKLDLPTDAAF